MLQTHYLRRIAALAASVAVVAGLIGAATPGTPATAAPAAPAALDCDAWQTKDDAASRRGDVILALQVRTCRSGGTSSKWVAGKVCNRVANGKWSWMMDIDQPGGIHWYRNFSGPAAGSCERVPLNGVRVLSGRYVYVYLMFRYGTGGFETVETSYRLP